MIPQKRWKLRPQSPNTAAKLAQHLNISPVIAQLLLNRDIRSLEYASNFLADSPTEIQFPDTQLQPIFERIMQCIAAKKVISVYGDYDVDGMTSTAMMVKCLTALGAVVRYKLPHRFHDGYGLNAGIVDYLIAEQTGLFITLDCGITNVDEIRAIKEQTSCDVIVIDHHQIPDPIPPADLILNPKSPGTADELVNLCTAGIVYKLVSYIAKQVSSIKLPEYLFLAAIGTVADVVPLTAENRRIVKTGLRLLHQAKNIGILSLLKCINWSGAQLSVNDVGFVIGPRLNAAGRLSSAHYGVDLLLTQDKKKATEIALYLERINQKRRQLDSDVFSASAKMIDESLHYQNQSVLVLGQHQWHAGVIGIAASKLVGMYSKPVVVVGIDEHIARGSARTVGDVNIYSLLKECSHLFTSFGGHKQAAGFSLKPALFGKFKETLEHVVSQRVSSDQLYESINIDMKLDTQNISFELLDRLSCMAPFGQANPEPVFYSDQLAVIDSKLVGNGKHLKLTFQDPDSHQCFDGIGFNLGEKLPCVYNNKAHIAFSLERNVWQNKENLQLNIKDIK